MSPEIQDAVRRALAHEWVGRRHPGRIVTLLRVDEAGFRFTLGAGLPRWQAWAALPVAMFAHMQERPNGPPIAMFHLLRDIDGHPAGSTVSRETIEAAGVRL